MEIKTTQRYHIFTSHIGKNSKCLITCSVGKRAGKQPQAARRSAKWYHICGGEFGSISQVINPYTLDSATLGRAFTPQIYLYTCKVTVVQSYSLYHCLK